MYCNCNFISADDMKGQFSEQNVHFLETFLLLLSLCTFDYYTPKSFLVLSVLDIPINTGHGIINILFSQMPL